MTNAQFTTILEQVLDQSKAEINLPNTQSVKSLRDQIYRAQAPINTSTVKENNGTITVYLWKEECRHGLNPYDCTICSHESHGTWSNMCHHGRNAEMCPTCNPWQAL